MTDKIHEILNFWFGDLGLADLPTSERTNLWFGENEKLKKHIPSEEELILFNKYYNLM